MKKHQTHYRKEEQIVNIKLQTTKNIKVKANSKEQSQIKGKETLEKVLTAKRTQTPLLASHWTTKENPSTNRTICCNADIWLQSAGTDLNS